ncbi:MAG: uncharacterized protein JWO13_3435 [Acidobacteriales bacterium]|nr:uncharacterized protein [Terriglobales bacterium]
MKYRIAIVSAMLASFMLLFAAGCAQYTEAKNFRTAVEIVGGDPHAGREAIQRYGCKACHTIPGVPGANATVGPSLDKFANRSFIAGEVPNNPTSLIHWIEKPHDVEPRTAMPDMGVSEKDSKDIATYLYSLR